MVNPATPTTSVTGASPSLYGNSITFNATVTGVPGFASPTGTLNFYDLSSATPTTPLTCTNPPGQNLVAGAPGSGVSTGTCNIASLTGGSHAIAASYVPAGTEFNYSAGLQSAPFPQQVNPFTPAIAVALTAGANPSVYGTSVTFTATVTGVAGLVSPTGTVSFANGVTPLTCIPAPPALSATTPGVSTTTCAISSLTGGTHSINAMLRRLGCV